MNSMPLSSIDAYIHAVLRYIPRTSPERQHIQEDIRTHLAERVDAGNSVTAAITAMGDPREVAKSYLGEHPLSYAPLGRRLGAAVIDGILILLPTVGLLIPSCLRMMTHTTLDRTSLILSFIVVTIVMMLYYPVTEAIYGQTLGKRLLGLIVVTESGLAIGAKEALIRRIPSILGTLITVDASFVFFGQKHQRAFDRVAKTVVVRTA